jgi:DUF1680 family protein
MPIREIPMQNVRIKDGFWSPRQALMTDVTIPYMEKILRDEVPEANRSHAIRNFRMAAGEESGTFYGMVFQDSDAAKWIEAAAYSLANRKDPELEKKLDDFIDVIAEAQEKDGYLDTYFTINGREKSWTNLLEAHELYCAGHMIEGAIAYYHATGKDKFLNTARRFADYLCLNFGKGKRNWVPGHEEIELALVKLYHETGEVKYLDLAETLIDRRGHGYGTWKHPEYYQDIVPVSELSEITGHAVRAMYLFSGMADVAVLRGRKDYTQALDRLWNDVILRKMYITGGIGSSKHNEGFTVPYDLPNKEA